MSEPGASFCVDTFCREQGPRHLHKPAGGEPSPAQSAPLTRTCPKCRSAMHRTYHDSRGECGFASCHDCHEGYGWDRCLGGQTEHLRWACSCGFAEVTPCADAEGKP